MKKPTPKSAKAKDLSQLIAYSQKLAIKTQDVIARLKALSAEIEADQKRREKSN
jgi:hypothetical protein